MPVDPDSPNPRSAGAELLAALEPVRDGIIVTAFRAGLIRGGRAARRAVVRVSLGGE